MNKNKGTSMFYVLVVVLFLVGWGLAFNGIGHVTGTGTQKGIVTGVEASGLIWKTGRAYIKTGSDSSKEDAYCVIDKAIYAELMYAAMDSKEVVIHHQSNLVYPVTACNSEGKVIMDIDYP